MDINNYCTCIPLLDSTFFSNYNFSGDAYDCNKDKECSGSASPVIVSRFRSRSRSRSRSRELPVPLLRAGNIPMSRSPSYSPIENYGFPDHPYSPGTTSDDDEVSKVPTF